jgi:23S rRNA (adenine2503-C2)-methyltransferase
MKPLVGLSSDELASLAKELGQPAYRGKQIGRWLYHAHAATFDEMSDLPAALRSALVARFTIGTGRCISASLATDGTEKLAVRFGEDAVVECVRLPYEDRVSVCLSCQEGCAMRCAFCATGLSGFRRNLTRGEILQQFLLLQARAPERRISHVVFMGMGEPMHNLDEVLGAARILVGEVGLSARSITVSTVGVVPGILQLADAGLPINLAVSLHAPDDGVRAGLIPAARKWPMSEVLDACRQYRARTGRDVTYEYLLIAGVNDDPDQAQRLADALRGTPGSVNLIPYNPVPGAPAFHRPSGQSVQRFRAVLEAAGRHVTQRQERGSTVDAACGQLRLRALREPTVSGGAL